MPRDERGFTLIELLVVVLVIAILAAIAVPVFLRQRVRGYESQIRSSIRNAVTAVESWAATQNGSYALLDHQDYPDYLTKLEGEGFVGVPPYLQYLRVEANATSYCIEARHDLLDGSSGWRRSTFDSSEGIVAPTPDHCPNL